MSPELDFRNTNSLWCSVLVETLFCCGVRSAVISPGSRSTPLTMALVRHSGIEAIPVLDERSACFFALGIAKRTHLPVVLVCTSGTAVANYLPAVVEAAESATPLLVLSSDRPPEMRACASGQTIDQLKLFGGYVRFHHEVAVPEPRLELLTYLRQTAAHAVQRSLRPTPGPAHLNFPFRDPLPPLRDDTAQHLHGAIGESFFSHLGADASRIGTGRIWQRATTSRGLIIAGPANPVDRDAYAVTVRSFAGKLGWPVLADALSPLRHYGSNDVPVVAHYDAILRDAKTATDLMPRTVIALGDWPTSKVLRSWLASSQAEILMLAEHGMNRDALHGRTRHLPFSPEQLDVEGSPIPDPSYREAWQAAEKVASRELDDAFEHGNSGLFEARVSRLLGRHLAGETAVFVASSMPVRDVEYFWPATDRRFRFFFNRGANGIDGTLSTALGVAHRGHPTVLLTGDLAFLHDANGLLISPRFEGSLLVVLINNNGGGIFEHLPIAEFDPPFEEFFATPQKIDFQALCRAHRIEHRLVADWAGFTREISKKPEAGIQVLEVRTDRKKDAVARKRLLAGIGRRVATELA